MPEKVTYSEIITKIITDDDRKLVVESIDDYLEAKDSRPELLTQSLSKLPMWLVKDLEGKSVTEIKDLQNQILDMKSLNLTLAIKPNKETITAISVNIKSTHPDACINLSVDPNLIAGIQIDFDGHWSDFSLSHLLKNYVN